MRRSRKAPESAYDRYIGLVRVSDIKQKESGLGLLAGRADLDRFISTYGGELLQVLEEVESGKHSAIKNRPTLLRAIALCKRHRACLLVPYISRLVRNQEVATDIKRSGVCWRACDRPNAGPFEIDIHIAIAAEEGRIISERTHKALEVYIGQRQVSKRNKVRLEAKYGSVENAPSWEIEAVAGKIGSQLGGCHLTDSDRLKGARAGGAVVAAEATEFYADLAPEMSEWRDVEKLTLAQIALRLNERGEKTRNGASWSPVQVLRCLRRHESEAK